jgi:hydrogenase maturation protease
MKLLIACIGNIFLGDDAFGVEVARHLYVRPLPEGVCVRDFGIRSYDLAYALMDDWDMVLLVDALPRGGDPGTLYLFEPELPAADEAPANPDAHSMNPFSVLQLVAALGGKVRHLLVLGCEPATVEASQEGNMELSTPVAAAVVEAVRAIEELIVRTRSQVTAA